MAQLTPSPKQAFLGADGNPLAGGKLYTYAAGTTTPLATYTDAAGATPNPNPIILDARGEATIFLLSQSYKFVLKTLSGATIYTQDDIINLSYIIDEFTSSTGSSFVGYLPAGTDASPNRSVQDKLRESVSVLDFGYPVTSNTFQNALNSCSDGKILRISGEITLSDQVIVPVGCAGIIGDGMRTTVITFTREQVDGTGIKANSAIVAEGTHGAVFEEFAIVYTGTFSHPTLSYWGLVAGLCVIDSNDVIINRIEVVSCNYAGIYMGDSSTYSYRNTIQNCFLHNNRVGGLMYEYQHTFTVNNCVLAYNGKIEDGGTGYGCSAIEGAENTNISIIGNRTDHNYRKGIDFHSGVDVLVTDNICIGDRIVGIFYENTTTKVASVVITNNFIRCDPDFSVAAPAYPYDYYRGISCYIAYNANTTNPNIIINNNELYDVYKTDVTLVDVIGIYVNNQSGRRTLTSITNNQIRGGKCLACIGLESPVRDTEVIALISGNQISVDVVGAYPIFSTPNSATAGGWLTVDNNSVVAVSSIQAVITVKTGYSETKITNNTAFLTTLTAEMVKVESTVNQIVTITDNSIITNTGHTNTKYYYGLSLITKCENNLYNRDLQSDTTRISNVGGGTKTYKGNKLLDAAVLTDVIRFNEDGVNGYYKLKWVASRSVTGPNAVAISGGELVFIAAYDALGQTTISALTELSNLSANNGTTDITLTWDVAVEIAGQLVRKLQATSGVSCSLYFELEVITSLDLSTGTRYLNL